MVHTSRHSPFAVIAGLPATNAAMTSIGLNQNRSNDLRQWRTSYLRPHRTPGALSQNPEPYLFVLLADQEIEAQRPEQAESLIEAAYAAFDQCKLGS